MDYSYAQPSAYPTQHKHRISPLLIILVLIVIIILLVLGLLLLISPSKPQTTISLNVVADPTGESMSISKIQIHTKGYEGSADVNIDLIDVTTNTIVASNFKRLNAGKHLVELNLPEKTGQYELSVKAEKESAKASRSMPFIVVDTNKPNPISGSVDGGDNNDDSREDIDDGGLSGGSNTGEGCMLECNDYSPCTIDICKNGECVFTPIEPCCGDRTCDRGETEQSCPQDCQEAPIGRDTAYETVTNQALSIAKTRPNDAVSLCKSLPQNKDVDDCLTEIVSKSKNEKICFSMISRNNKDSCLVDIVVRTNKFALCDQIEDRWLKSSCYSYRNLRN